MNIQIIYHGSLKKFNNNQSEKIFYVHDGTSVGEMMLLSAVPKDQIAFAALNGSRVKVTHVLKDGDEVKLFQFVGGG
jgi:sulfur carrier protein ThiS